MRVLAVIGNIYIISNPMLVQRIIAESMKHCPLCNASSADVRFFGEFCENCLGKKLKAELPGYVELEVCKECGRARLGKEFLPLDETNTEQILKGRYKGYSMKLVSMHLPLARIRVTETDSGLTVEKGIDIGFRKMLCDTCSRRRGGYFESVIQFRGNPERINRLIASLQNYLNKNDGFIAKVEELHSGVNVFVSSRALVTEFLSRKNLKGAVSFTLHTEKRGKRLYRSTYSVRV